MKVEGEGSERTKNLGAGGQRQKIVRFFSIRPRFEVLVEGLTLSTHCDDYVYPMTRWSLDIEHVSSILEVRNSLVLRVLYRERSEEHMSELQSHLNLVCRLLLEKKKN